MILLKLRHKLGKWLWKENEWTKAVDDIEKVCKQISDNKIKTHIFYFKFLFMRPPNKFKITVEQALKGTDGKETENN
jgi:hypothetical protein